MFFKSSGKVWYGNNYAVVWVDDQIAQYYRAILPKYLEINPPKYPAHITVCRRDIEIAKNNWLFRNGQTVKFIYRAQLYYDELYVWLECWSNEIAQIRKELGLPVFRHDFNSYHITIGNFKT